MTKAKLTRRHTRYGAVLGAGVIALGALARPSRVFAAPLAARQSATTTANVVFRGAGFSPLVSRVVSGETIKITSTARTKLHLVSAPQAPQPVTLTVAAGGRVSLRLTKPGVYLLYDDVTTRFDRRVGQVAARKGSRQYPLPAYAVMVVTNRAGGGIQPTGAHVNIPDTSMTFQPWVTVVKAGTPVTFTNNDMDLHVVTASTEPMITPKSGRGEGPLKERMSPFAPLTLPAHGGSATITLNRPGVYHYYCPVHAAYDEAYHTFQPLKNFGSYPFVMDGVIVVLPNYSR